MLASAADLLKRYTSESELQQIARLWKLPFRAGADRQSDMLQQIGDAYTAGNIQARFAELPEQDQDLLVQLAVLSAANQELVHMHVAARQVNERLNSKGVGEKKLRELAETGLLFVLGSNWKSFVVVPLEVWSAIVGRYADKVANRIERRPVEGQIEQMEHMGLALYHDILTVVAACVHEPVEVSQKGEIYKRAAQRIMKLLNSKEQQFPAYFGEGLPRSFSFIISFLEQKSVIDLDERVLVMGDALESFLSVDYIDWCELLHSHYISRCFIPRGTADSFVSSIMYRLGLQGWSSAEEALRIIGDIMTGWGMHPGNEKLEQIAIWSYVALGLMKLGKDRKGERMLQWTDWGKEYILTQLYNKPDYASRLEHLLTGELFVQPNLEIVVPENVLPAIRWRIEALADLKQADSVLIYELSKPRIVQALEAGWTLESIRTFLDSHSKNPIADNVYQTIRGWIGHYGKAQFWDAMVLQLNDLQLAAAVQQDKRLSKLIIASLAADCLVIRRSDEQEVRELLESLGYPPALRVRNPDDISEGGGNFNRFDRAAHRTKCALYERNLEVLAPNFCSLALKKEEVLKNIISQFSIAHSSLPSTKFPSF